jgi:hypothetical protein
MSNRKAVDKSGAKLGRKIVEKYPVYNHSAWENVLDMGDGQARVRRYRSTGSLLRVICG